jgi:hypothetical protein
MKFVSEICVGYKDLSVTCVGYNDLSVTYVLVINTFELHNPAFKLLHNKVLHTNLIKTILTTLVEILFIIAEAFR